MIGRIVITLASEVDGDHFKAHVRHEAQDGLWDSRDTMWSARPESEIVEEFLRTLPDRVREVLAMSRDRARS